MTYTEKLRQCGAIVPELVVPTRGVDKTKYACIACDQYNAEPRYWQEVKDFVGKELSSLYFIMPEAWLGPNGKPDSQEHADHQELLAANMKFFLVNGGLDELEPGMVYLERTLKDGKTRRGLVLALDLENYDYTPGSKSLIRATEKTVEERIPVRTAIRAKAPLECPHIMVLYADKENRLNTYLSAVNNPGKWDIANDGDSVLPTPLYDFDLMMGAGHMTGYHITDAEKLDATSDILLALKAEAKDGMLFAMGDGNHSLAAAKANWDAFKKYIPEAQRFDHPARFALVELVNLYDEALTFEPINRIIKNVDPAEIQSELGFDASNPPSLQELQPKLDEYIKNHPGVVIDYIHGIDTAKKLAAEAPDTSLAICWEDFDRDSLFDDVIKNGCLVRKSFSMGHADDKRFYYEARRITKISKEHIVPNASWNL